MSYEKYKKVNFMPWIGAEYDEGWNGEKLLVLGESHYCVDVDCKVCNLETCKAHGFTEDEFHDQTIDAVKGYLSAYEGTLYQQTYLCFERAVLGREASDAEKLDFWNHLAFYNYVQRNLKKKVGRCTGLECADSENEDAFKEVLEALMPDRVIVWGMRLYDALPAWGGYESGIMIGSYTAPIWTYRVNGKDIPCMAVYHPSTPNGKSWSYWHPFYEGFLEDGFKALERQLALRFSFFIFAVAAELKLDMQTIKDEKG